MKARLFSACAFFAASLAASAFAQTAAPQPPPAPVVVAQMEIRGLESLVDQAARIAAPFIPREQLEGIVKGYLSTAFPVDLLALVGESSAEPIRVALFAKPGAKDIGAIFDLPAAGGDIDAFLDVVGRSCTSSAVPAAVAAHLPLSARIYRLPDTLGFDDPRLLLLPHGDRVAACPLALRGGASPVQAANLVSAFSDIEADGVLAFRLDADAARTLAERNPAASESADSLRDLSVAAVSIGIGLDAADRFRLDQTCALLSGTAHAAYFSAIGAPAPFVNAALFPDALAANVQRTDPALLGALAEEIFAPALSGDGPRARALGDLVHDLFGLIPSLASLFGTDAAWSLCPPAPGKPFPWVLCTARPDGIEIPADLAARANDLAGSVLALAARAMETIPHDDDLPDLPAFVLEPRGERTVGDVPIQTFALRMVPAEGSETAPRDLYSFDVALAGPALVLADLPDDRLSEVLAALAPDAPARPGIDALPAFAAAYGPLPQNASAGCVKLVPFLRAILGFGGARLAEVKELIDFQAAPETRALADALDPFLEALAGIDLPLAVAVRPGASPDSFRETISVPLADLHSLATALAPLAAGLVSDGDPDDTDAPFDEW